MTGTDKTLNVTITESGMRRLLQMFRAELKAQQANEGIVDTIIDLAFSMGANYAGSVLSAEFTQAHVDAIRAERERIITDERA